MKNRSLIISIAILIVLIGIGTFGAGNRPVSADPSAGEGLVFKVSEPSVPSISPPVRELPIGMPPVLYREINPLRNPSQFQDGLGLKGSMTQIHDPLADRNQIETGETPGLLFDFEGLGTDGFAPPDTIGEVGPNHYVQMVNVSFAVFDKSGTMLSGPHPYNSLFTGHGGVCETNNDGDPIVIYDELADRWALIQFADIFGSMTMCIAVSTTPDPTGTYFTYDFSMPDIPDYMKFGVWPDGYYMGTNSGSPNAYYAHVFDRDQMLAGLPATAQSFGGYANFLMPSDLDGDTPPPAGAPNYFYTFLKQGYANHPPGVDRIEVFEFDVDWDTPANSTFTLADTIPIAAFNYTVCGFFVQNCVPQPGTAQRLDTLSYWPMWRFQYRNFGVRETLVGNFTVDLDGTDKAAIRWFELRNSPSGWELYQEGTFAPDSHHRWMGSIAMDGSGNIAMGYSVGSNTLAPAIRYATRLDQDPLGTFQTEASLIEGGGVQTSIVRWGDYSAITVDPADDCTFWFTSEYHDANDGGFNWNTRVGVFKEPTCTGTLGPDFVMSATPAEQDVCAPADAIYTIGVGGVLGFGAPVSMAAQGHPAGTSAVFDTNPVTPGGSSNLTIGSTGSGTPGSYSIDVIGTTVSKTHTSTVGLNLFSAAPISPTLVAPANGAVDQSSVPLLSWSAAAQASLYDLQIATDAAFANVIYTAQVAGTSHQVAAPLDPISNYFWRVKALNTCGEGPYSAPFSFLTGQTPAILLVEDEGSGSAQLSKYTDSLDNLGYSYTIWDTTGSDIEPDAADLAEYEIVIWYSGALFGLAGSGPAGPSPATETALGGWLDAGGCLFISSQDYRYDKGLTGFMTGYLGVSNVVNDSGDYTSITGEGVFAGLGPYSLTYPFTDYSDPITVGNGGTSAMRGNNDNVGGSSKETAAYKTTYWAFPWEALPASGRDQTMETFIDWCAISVSGDGYVSGNVLLQGRADHQGAQVTAWQSGSPVQTDTTASSGNFYSLSLPSGTYSVTVGLGGYLASRTDGVVVTSGGVTNLPSRVLLGGDVNGDGTVDILDLSAIGAKYGLTSADPGYDPDADINADGVINIQDLSIAAGNYGLSAP